MNTLKYFVGHISFATLLSFRKVMELGDETDYVSALCDTHCQRLIVAFCPYIRPIGLILFIKNNF